MINEVSEFIAQHEQQTFRYGKSDCVLFGVAAAKHIWQIDVSKEVGHWTSKKEAAQAMSAFKGGLLGAARTVMAKTSMKAVSGPLLRCGDIVMVDMKDRVAVGLMENAADIVVLGASGLLRVPRQFAIIGWRG